MEWTTDFERAEKYAVVTTRGLFSPEDHLRMTEDVISREEWHPGMTVLSSSRARSRSNSMKRPCADGLRGRLFCAIIQ